jgi:hypothetical protein
MSPGVAEGLLPHWDSVVDIDRQDGKIEAPPLERIGKRERWGRLLPNLQLEPCFGKQFGVRRSLTMSLPAVRYPRPDYHRRYQGIRCDLPLLRPAARLHLHQSQQRPAPSECD